MVRIIRINENRKMKKGKIENGKIREIASRYAPCCLFGRLLRHARCSRLNLAFCAFCGSPAKPNRFFVPHFSV